MIRKGTNVKWKWAKGEAYGKVVDTFQETVTKTIKGSEVTRHGEKGNSVLLIRQEDGDEVLKLEQTVERAK